MTTTPVIQQPQDWEGPALDEAEITAVSAAEERFERGRRTVGLWLGPLAFIVLWLLPLDALKPEAHRLSAVVSLVVVWWVTEAVPIPATALIGAALTVVCGVTNATTAFAPFASPTIFLFIGSFIIGQAVQEHGLDRRLAFGLLSLRAVRGSVGRIRIAMGSLCLLISGWMSNSATTAMMLPVAMGVLAASGLAGQRHRSFSIGLLLTVAYGASVGGIMTPVGTPPNLITLGLLDQLAGVRINFLTWMILTTPIAIVLAIAMFLLAAWLFPTPPQQHGAAEYLDRAEHEAGPWTRGQINCAIAFGVAAALWITPGALAAAGLGGTPWVRALTPRLDEAVVAIVAASLLFILPIDWPSRRFTIGWKEASQIDWGTILLFGGGLSLGHLMFVTGLAEHLGRTLVAWSGVSSLWGVTAVAAALGILLTEVTSNTAATNMLVPVVISIAQASGVSPVTPALAACIGASMAFMLPISTPPNAIVYGSRLVPITAMIRFGVLLDIVAFVIILAGLWLMAPLVGLA